MATLQRIDQPSCFRSGVNLSGSDIPAKRIVKAGTSAHDEVALATAVTDAFVGVTVETIYDQQSQSVQVDGRALVTSGAAITVGQELTTDASGKAVPATQAAGASQRVIGVAKTAASGADEDVEVELRQMGILWSSLLAVADRTALKAIDASSRFDGMLVLVKTDNSLWRFNAAAAQNADAAAGSEQFVAVPGAGTGRWHRADKSFVASFAFVFGTLDAAALCTIPEGFTARIVEFPFWEVDVAFSGGSSSAIGVSTNKTSYNTKGDLLGGAAGDVEAGLTAGVKAGTIGPKLDTLAERQALILVEGDVIRFDRITSVFTAGAGKVRVPMIITSNDSPTTP